MLHALVRVLGSLCYSEISGNNFLRMPESNLCPQNSSGYMRTYNEFGKALNILAA